MARTSVMAAMTAIAILISPIVANAQSAGGAASGPSAGTGSAVGTPNVGSAGAGTPGIADSRTRRLQSLEQGSLTAPILRLL